ncbi:MAG: zinc-dependent peptidase [Pseudomonadota bacterium]
MPRASRNPIREWLNHLARPFAPHPARAPLEAAGWDELQRDVPFIGYLVPDQQARLRDHIETLLGSKEFVGIDGEPAPRQCRIIAAYAALPVLELGLEPYRHWRTVILYPDTFVPEHEWMDEDGIMHRGATPQSGEAWEHGPVVLSWQDVLHDGAVVVHEMMHVLDAGNGEVNGFPPLPRGQSRPVWTRTFSEAYAALVARVEAGESPQTLPLDPYAATAPEEFLAVAAESFFFEPAHLRATLPSVYAQLAAYFGQKPHRRATVIATSPIERSA